MADTFEAAGLNYSVTDGEATLTGPADTSITALTIPATVTDGSDTYPVTAVAASAFANCSSLTSVTIADGDSELAFPNYVFQNCPIETVYLGRSYTFTGSNFHYNPFYGNTSITSVTIGKSMTSVPQRVFQECTSLKEVTLMDGDSDISFGYYVFTNCPIEKVYVGRNLSSSTSSSQPFQSHPSITSVTISDAVTSVATSMFTNCTGITSITIPESVTSIGGTAFSGCTSLTSVTFEDGDSEIDFGANVFSNCPLETVYLGRDFTYSSYYYSNQPFYGNSSITSLTIGDTVTNILDYAFANCSGITSLTLGSSLVTIGNYSFRYCTGLTEITIPDAVTAIGSHAFADNPGLTKVTLGSSLATIGTYAFYKDGITELTIPDSVTEIGANAFHECSALTKLSLGNSAATIGTSAFISCSALTELSIPGSVTSISNSAFANCASLTSVTLEEGDSPLAFGSYVFNYDPIETLRINRNFSGTGVNTNFPFYGLTSLESLTIGEAVTEIGAYSFQGCTALKTVTIEDADTDLTISTNVFTLCPIETLYLGRNPVYNASTYYYYPLYSLTSLSELTIGEKVTSIGEHSFGYCSALVSVKSNAVTPPHAAENSFASEAYANATLTVPDESLQLYRDHDVWSKFIDIAAVSAIGSVNADSATDASLTPTIDYTLPYEVYNLQGQSLGSDLTRLPAGAYVIRQGHASQKVRL